MPKKFKAVEGTDGYVYPITSTDLVVDSENKPITETLNSTKTKLAEHEANIESNANRINNAEERMTAIEVKNEQQDERLKNIEGKNKAQDIDLKCLFADAKDGTVNISEEGNNVKLQNSRDGYVVVNEIEGNTLVNCNKEPNKELILNGNIDTSGDNSITLTEGVDGGLVDVALEGNTLVNVSKTKDATPITHKSEDTTGNHVVLDSEGYIRPVLNGNTMVNVCDQKDPVAITKSYTVETGNHVALQGEYDGKCRPVVNGNTLVNIANIKNKTTHWRSDSLTQQPKSNTLYTFIINITNPTGDSTYSVGIVNDTNSDWSCFKGDLIGGYNVFSLTTNSNPSDVIRYGDSANDVTATFDILILEGDYTNKPTPGYFEGIQSSFEDKVVTQEMVDAGEESAENLGKYKVDYVISKEDGTVGFTKTFYLNSPLLEGDTIEQQGDNVVHVHRSELRAYETDDELTLLTDMTNTLVSKATPQYEVISQNDTILCDSYVNGHLDVDSVVPIEKVDFMTAQLSPLKYVYGKTKYTLQFESDNVGKIDYLMMGQETKTNIDVIKGVNKINITTFSTSPYIDFRGIGFNASNIVVTQAIEQDFGYFSGLSSTFEDNLVTQEMVDAGEELADNLGKYRVDYKVTGKNKFDINKPFTLNYGIQNVGADITISGNGLTTTAVAGVCSSKSQDYTGILKPNTDYTISAKSLGCNYYLRVYDNKAIKDIIPTFIVGTTNRSSITFNIGNTNPKDIRIIFHRAEDISDSSIIDIQLEEGNTATSYELYKEYTKTLYFNSPPLEGDTIEEKDGGIYHVHRSKEVVLDGSKMWYASTQWISSLHFWCKIEGKGGSMGRLLCDKNNEFYGDGYYWTDNILFKNDVSNFNNIEEFKTWLQTNRPKVLCQLAEPQYELIEQFNLAIPSYANGHLDFNTAVPVEKVEFKPFSEELTYLYANTQYTVQFISDKATTADITLGGTPLLAQSIVVGLNRISITTPETLVDNKLIISGVGANISEVVVTDTNREFGYFEGMKSVGECEELEIESGNKNLFDYNKFCQFVDEIKSSSPDGYFYHGFKIKVKPNTYYKFAREDNSGLGLGCYIVINDLENGYNSNSNFFKWIAHSDSSNLNASERVLNTGNRNYIYINTAFNSNTSNDIINNIKKVMSTVQLEEGSTATDYIAHEESAQTLTHEPLRAVGDIKDRYVLIDGKWYIERNCGTVPMDYIRLADDLFKGVVVTFENRKNNAVPLCDSSKYVSSGVITPNTFYVNPINIVFVFDLNDSRSFEELVNLVKTYNFVYELATPQYEPIDYNPFTVYSDVTHISNNSTIPCNMVIKNTGYNCLLKPSTTYTVSSNLGLNTVTTPSTLTEDCLRFMDTDTSDVTTMKDVLVLEGDWTTKADLIPVNFSGIESAFEQELVTDETDEHFGKYKVNVKVANEDKSKESNIVFYVGEPLRGIGDVKDKVYVKNDKVIVERNYGSITFDGSDDETWHRVVNSEYPEYQCVIKKGYSFGKCNNFKHAQNGNYERFAIDSISLYIKIYKAKLQTQDVAGFKQWLQQHPTTVVYQLAEPVYEEVEYDGNKLIAESFKDGTLFYDSNVPVSSNINYTFTVPVIDEVSALSTTTDEQDTTIASLAYIQNMQAINSK